MLKTRLFVALILSVLLCVSAQAPEPIPEEDEGQDDYLKVFAHEYKTHIVDKQHLTCENYENYCNSAGVADFADAQSCKIWSKNYLCNHGTDIESLRKTVHEIEAALAKSP
ncbi:venom protein T precursor [Nasonia vitripennis]|uniref:Uncharacterized protein n=1 Tax=Nasonia vitripennis TaxID=7425 RepID=A0A7M6UFE8_NASVI|nr:venom protein T precursor [Nasonia vitripennis]